VATWSDEPGEEVPLQLGRPGGYIRMLAGVARINSVLLGREWPHAAAPRVDVDKACRMLDAWGIRCPEGPLSDYGLCLPHLSGAAGEFQALLDSGCNEVPLALAVHTRKMIYELAELVGVSAPEMVDRVFAVAR
jgi:hypothetical protein